jgi:hypothetical protein
VLSIVSSDVVRGRSNWTTGPRSGQFRHQSKFTPRLALSKIELETAGKRAAVAVLFAIVAGAIAWRAQYLLHGLGGDHLVLWRAAHIVLDGGDPYQLIWLMDLPALRTPFNYPLPAVAMGMPFAQLLPPNAAIAFVTCSAALLGFALTRSGFEFIPMLLSVPFFFAAQLAQTSFLILALALIPAAAGLTVMKPNIGLALFLWRPCRRTVFFGAALVLGSVLIVPEWPAEWVQLVRTSPAHHAPGVVGFGAIALLAITRWRRPEARLLVAMTLIPHGLYFYDELPLWLIADSRRQSMVLAFASWLGWLGWVGTSGPTGPRITDSFSWCVLSLYIPCLVFVLRRPNEGRLPDSLERRIVVLPSWLRGRAPA